MQFRFHRGAFEDSMNTVLEFKSYCDLLKIMNNYSHDIYGQAENITELTISPYVYDSRNEWDTHLVLFKETILGFVDGPIKIIVCG